ncbi:hypothetical protein V8C35DRAFT_42181 [Trichoderma chlorosporum]
MLQKRKIDDVPTPLKKSPVKVIVLSCSKTGTLGLYRAFKILGYKPYHAAEFIQGPDHNHKIFFQEALLAENSRFSGVRPYSRAEFDKWFQQYDSIVEVPSYMPVQIYNAYCNDPDVKFLLTEREPDKWVRSFNRQVGGMNDYLASFSMTILKYFDMGLWHHWRFNTLVYNLFSGTTRRGHPENEQILRQNYVNYNKLIKELVPKEKLRVIKLEEGLGWDELCDFLEVSKPDVPYPNFADHMEIRDALVGQMIKRAMIKLSLMTAAIVGAVVFGWKTWKK